MFTQFYINHISDSIFGPSWSKKNLYVDKILKFQRPKIMARWFVKGVGLHLICSLVYKMACSTDNLIFSGCTSVNQNKFMFNYI